MIKKLIDLVKSKLKKEEEEVEEVFRPLMGYEEKFEELIQDVVASISPHKTAHVKTIIEKIRFAMYKLERLAPEEQEISETLDSFQKKILNTEVVDVPSIQKEVEKLEKKKNDINVKIKKEIKTIKYLLTRLRKHSLEAHDKTLPIIKEYIYLDNEWPVGMVEKVY